MTITSDTWKQRFAQLATQGVYLGTSSWKYPGWRGQLYDEARYLYHDKVSEARFERECLAEYATVFKSVCVDAAYYKFPDQRYLAGLVAQVPSDFLFTFKVTDEITIKKFTNLPRFGRRAGQPNENFLNADLFTAAFLGPCAAFRRNIGLLMFEFSHFYSGDFARGRDFMEALDGFLAKLPSGWRYGVETRNRNFLHPDYFAMLSRHGVAHVFNSWQDMPTIGEQMTLPGSQTTPDFLGARFLLKPGRKYEDAVKLFSPYENVKEINAAGRAAGTGLIERALAAGGKTKAFIYVNNRFEGNAPQTLQALVESLGSHLNI